MTAPSPAVSQQGLGAVSGDLLNTYVQSVANVAQLRSFVGLTGMAVYLEGTISVGDGGQGHYVYSATATAADNGLSVIKPTSVGTSPGAWLLNAETPYPPLWGGLVVSAPNNGTTDATATIKSYAALGVPLFFPPGSYLLSSSITFSAPVTMAADASFLSIAGTTLTFNANFSAPLSLVFGTNITAVFAPSTAPIGCPEWWGFVVNVYSGSQLAVNLAAINACIVACPITQLQYADYVVSGTVQISTSYRTLRGTGYTDNTSPQNSRLIVNSSTADVLLIGTLTSPGGISNFVSGVQVYDLSLHRAVNGSVTGPTPPSSGFSGGPAGFRLSYAFACYIRRVWTIDSYYGGYVTATVYSFIEDCHHKRQTAGTTSVNDGGFALFLDYSANIGLNGGIASLYVTRGGFEVNTSLGLTLYGIYTNQGFVDTYIRQFETSGSAYGFYGNGSGAGVVATENLSVSGCVFDQCSIAGLAIESNNAATCAFSFTDNYVGITGGSTGSGILIISNGKGAGTIVGNKVIAGSATGPNIGLQINGAGLCIKASGNIYTDCLIPVDLTGAANCQVSDVIENGTYATTSGSGFTTNAAVQMSNCSRCKVDCIVSQELAGGTTASYTAGVNLSGTGNTYNEINLTTVSPTSITGGAANKLWYNGAAWGGGSTIGTGNVVTGVLN